MKQLIPLLIIMAFGCTSAQKENTSKVAGKYSISDSTAITFSNAHIQKYIAGDFQAAYNDYSNDFKSAYSYEQFMVIYKQLIPLFGILKSAEYKSISRGQRYSITGTSEIAALIYKADIDKPNTFINIEITTNTPVPQVVSYNYYNYLNNKIPENMR